jgi:hypothetical protein
MAFLLQSAQTSEKSMLRKLEIGLLALLLVLAITIGIVWLHSSFIGHEQTWSDPSNQTCYRIASADGRFLYQWCDLKSSRPQDDPTLRWERRVPADFFVGTNPDGERTVVLCGPIAVPFTFPAAGLFVGLSTKTEDAADPTTSTRWSHAWREYTVSYWFILILLLLAPVIEGIRHLKLRHQRS